MKVYLVIQVETEETNLEELSKMMYDSAAHIIFAEPHGGDTICELDAFVYQVSKKYPS